MQNIVPFLARRSLLIQRKRYWCIIVAYPICRSVCVSGKCTVAKWQIGSGCFLGWWMGQSRDRCIRWGNEENL